MFGSFAMILVMSLWFSHVSGGSGGRANGRANPPRAQASLIRLIEILKLVLIGFAKVLFIGLIVA